MASIDWFFDGYLLQSSIEEGISIKDRFSSVSKTIHSTLQIKKATMSSSGTYTCRSADQYVKEYRITVLSDGELYSQITLHFCSTYSDYVKRCFRLSNDISKDILLKMFLKVIFNLSLSFVANFF